MKLSTLAVILATCLWMPGYLHYGWLLVQTIASAPSLWISILFSVQFLLWLFPMAGLFVLAIVEKLGTTH